MTAKRGLRELLSGGRPAAEATLTMTADQSLELIDATLARIDVSLSRIDDSLSRIDDSLVRAADALDAIVGHFVPEPPITSSVVDLAAQLDRIGRRVSANGV